MSTRSSPVIGQTISHYKILEKLGEGGMGVVYKAQDLKLDRRVALKFLPAHSLTDKDAKERFINEAKAASALEHPNICNIHEIDETDDGQVFIAMAVYDGVPLNKKIERSPLGIDEAIDIAVQTAEGLQAAHEKGIIHRDVKCSNVMITEKGRAVVMDFGLARTSGVTKLTKPGATLGTVPYMSPEQARGEKVDHRTDIWSLGVVLYEMIAGRMPFRSEYQEAIVYSILNQDPEPLTSLRTGVPMELERIVQKCLEKNPLERYQHTDEIIVDLRRIRKGSKTETLATALSVDTPYRSGTLKESHGGSRGGELREEKKKSSTTVSITLPAIGKSGAIGLGVVLVLVVVGIGVLMFVPKNKTIQPLPGRVAVSLFENRTGHPEYGYLSKSISEFVTQGLVQIRVVDVVPTETVFSLMDASAGLAANIQRLADHGKATLVVSGGFTVQGNELSLSAKITDVVTNEAICAIDAISGPKDRPAELLEKLRSRILGAVAVRFEKLLPTYLLVATTPPTYDAYVEMKRGLDLFAQGDSKSAIPHFLNSFAIDSLSTIALHWAISASLNIGSYAKAESLVAKAEQYAGYLTPLGRIVLRSYKAETSGDQQAVYRAYRELSYQSNQPNWNFDFGLHALRINRPNEAIGVLQRVDPESAVFREWPSYWGIFTAAYHVLGDHQSELETARRGLSARPELLVLVGYEMRALAALGLIDEIDKRAERVFSLPAIPGQTPAWVLRATAVELRAHGHFEAAKKLLDLAIHWYRTRPSERARELRSEHAVALYEARHWAESQRSYETLLQEAPENITYRGYLGILHARLGNSQAALEQSRWLAELDGKSRKGTHTLWRARIAAVLGENENAMSFLREAFAQGASYGIGLHRDPAFEGVRDSEPFRKLLKTEERSSTKK